MSVINYTTLRMRYLDIEMQMSNKLIIYFYFVIFQSQNGIVDDDDEKETDQLLRDSNREDQGFFDEKVSRFLVFFLTMYL